MARSSSAPAHDPVAQSSGFLRIRREPDSSLVRHPAGGLEHTRLRSGAGGADATAEQVAGQRPEIEFRIIAAEAEAKAPFTRRVAMTGAHVAACLGEQRHDVVAVADRPPWLGLRLAGLDGFYAGRAMAARASTSTGKASRGIRARRGDQSGMAELLRQGQISASC